MSNLEHYFENLLFEGKDCLNDVNKNSLTKEEQEAVEACAAYVLYSIFCNRDNFKEFIYSDPIIKCKECKYSSYEPHEGYKNVYICNRTVWTRMNGGNTADDYCSYGRIKEE